MWAFFILLAVAIAVWYIGKRLVPLAMPPGRLMPVAVGVGLVGAFAGNLLGAGILGFIPSIEGVNLLAAALGAAIFVLLLGLYPFIKILLGRGGASKARIGKPRGA